MIVLRLAQSTTEPGYMPRLHADCVNEPVQLQLRDCLQLVQVVITLVIEGLGIDLQLVLR